MCPGAIQGRSLLLATLSDDGALYGPNGSTSIPVDLLSSIKVSRLPHRSVWRRDETTAIEHEKCGHGFKGNAFLTHELQEGEYRAARPDL